MSFYFTYNLSEKDWGNAIKTDSIVVCLTA